MNLRHAPVVLTIVTSLALAACGEDVEDRAVDRNTPAFTTESGIPYENGGGDGSGADGLEKPSERGGIAAGPDSPNPQDEPDADESTPPSEGGSTE